MCQTLASISWSLENSLMNTRVTELKNLTEWKNPEPSDQFREVYSQIGRIGNRTPLIRKPLKQGRQSSVFS